MPDGCVHTVNSRSRWSRATLLGLIMGEHAAGCVICLRAEDYDEAVRDCGRLAFLDKELRASVCKSQEFGGCS